MQNDYYRIWFWVQPVVESDATFSIKRDSIYIAVVLWGLGGSVLMVLSLSMISILTGEYTVSNLLKYLRSNLDVVF